MANAQDGKITSSNSTPFATSGGKPTNTAGANIRPTNFSTSPTGRSDNADDTRGGRNFNEESRTQTPRDEESPTPQGDAPHLRSRPQTTSASEGPDHDVRPEQRPPTGGKFFSDSPATARQGAGSHGNTRSPMKGMK